MSGNAPDELSRDTHLVTGALRCGEHVAGEYRFVELEGVSHWISEQAPSTVARTVLNYVL